MGPSQDDPAQAKGQDGLLRCKGLDGSTHVKCRDWPT